MAKISASPDSNIFLQVPGFSGEGVRHGFFGRAGGASGGIYGGLNCGVGSSDNPADVKANREAVATLMGVEAGNILSLYQVHGDICLKVKEPPKDRPQADAQVTDVPGLAISILTADCAPVLFYGRNEKGPVIGAAHAGWKGALGGVLDSTVYAMEEYGVNAKDIRAAIGPCISKRSYEVAQDFAAPFLNEDPENERFFMNGEAGKLMFDLPGYCASRLYNCGLTNVAITGIDTYANERDYFSFRRATHRKEPDYGRQISVIVIA
ncbi:MAG: peptidoglycan editing factor PgeF [Alphaproteobacteria bacterium]|jgi:YfiH family protein|nr:peptidoglycan editing factor PgeF [Alphaproteobacteria bacterium]